MLDWLPCRSAFNPIEDVLRALKQKLYWLYSNLYELKKDTVDMVISTARIKKAWECVDQAHIQRLVASIPARLNTCQDAEG